jgi:hypothetical protein
MQKKKERLAFSFPEGFPDDLFPIYKGGTIMPLNRNPDGNKSTPLASCCVVAHNLTIPLGFKLIVGRPC